jgi:O-antigen/teichoic acid export membrane protein
LLAYRGIPFVLPTFRQARTHLAEGLSLFLGRTAVSLYTTANGFILGLFVSPIFVGYFAAAERINRGVLVLQGPLAQTMYSHINHVMAKDPDAAKKIQRINFLVTVGTASVIGLMLFLAAPYLVPTLLGKQFVPAIRALQVMCLLSPLVAAATSLGAHILLPHGFDKAYTKIVILAAVINFSVAAILAPHYKHVGMCVAVVISEIAVSGGSFLFLVRKGLNPFARQSSDSQAKGIGIFPVPARSKS